MSRRVPLLLLLLLGAACLREVRLAGPEADGLLRSALWVPEGRLVMRQSALVTVGSRRIPIEGVLELDPVAGSARLVALDPLGVKLFDVTVRRDGPAETHGSPIPGTAGAIAAVSESLQRIYLTPPSGPATELRREGETRVVSIMGGPVRETWVIDSAGRLSDRTVRGRGNDWEVSYRDHLPLGEVTLPGEIDLGDRKAGYRLTIRTIEVLRGGK